MPVTPTYPGVYVQEVPSGVRTIAGVATSIAVFIGQARQGPMNKPILCLNYTDFTRVFTDDTAQGQLPFYVKLFFLNGGTQCYVVRTANGFVSSSVTLLNEGAAPDGVLTLTAKDAGLAGENIRALVSYSGPQPEATFNLELFRYEVQNGVRARVEGETWKNLTMDPAAPLFAATFLTQNSRLVNAAVAGTAPAAAAGFSLSGRPVEHANTDAGFQAAWAALIGSSGGAVGTRRNRFQLSVDGSRYVEIDLNNPALDVAAMAAGTVRSVLLPAAIETRINQQFAAAGLNGVNVEVTFEVGPTLAADETSRLRIRSTGTGDIFIRPGGTNDLAVPLMLGTEQGGLEVGAHAGRRPAPTGISFLASDPTMYDGLGSVLQNGITQVTLDELQPAPLTGFVAVNVAANLVTTGAADPIFVDNIGGSANANSDGLREKLAIIAAAVNARRSANPRFPWTAEVSGSRITFVPIGATADNFLSANFAMGGAPAGSFGNNVKMITLGAGGLGVGSQIAGATGSDGTAPLANDYDSVYTIIDQQVDLFNLMVLPPSAAPAVTVQSLYGAASGFCERKRAFLLMDPPEAWGSAQAAIDATSGVNSLRVGLAKQHSALYFPRVTIDDRGKKLNIGPAGAMAGLYARTDGTRGVWKAPAGTEADLRGITALERRFSDGENGVLNPRAINTLRVFPNGIVSWGARTMDGDDDFGSEYKYVPIRRLALYMEESLYRGLKWAVFEPNDEPLWSQIRLNVGSFMHNLFRQGAFQGATPKEAYFVKCDRETTTQNDRNLGIVNVWVGFAPLKPAEFVVLYLQQMAGQIET
jgi:phage tail sheath protein FI